MQPIGFEWAPSVRWAKECEKDCVTVGRSWRWIWASRHYSDKFEVQLYRCKKRELNPYPPTKPLRRPHRNDKSEAHAIWREHSLTYSFFGSLKEISQVSKARTIAECYLINMLKISLFCHNARGHASLSEIIVCFKKSYILCLFLFLLKNVLLLYQFVYAKVEGCNAFGSPGNGVFSFSMVAFSNHNHPSYFRSSISLALIHLTFAH